MRTTGLDTSRVLPATTQVNDGQAGRNPTTLGSSSGWGVSAGTPARNVSQPDDSRIGPDRRIHRTAALDDPYGPGTAAGTDDPKAVTQAGGERRKPPGDIKTS